MSLTRRDSIKLTLVATLVVVLGLVALRTEAVGTTFATYDNTGGLELKIDSTAYYNGDYQPGLSWELKNLVPGVDKFFNFADVKPGDTGTNTISIHIRKNPAWMCLDFLNLEDFENGINEPESLVDDDEEGELSSELEFFAWFDDNDQTYEVGETPMFGTSTQTAREVLKGETYVLRDSEHGAPQYPLQTKYVSIVWCAGDLEVNLDTAEISCDATAMGNQAQTDSMTLDVSIRAVSAYALPKYVCRKPDVWPGPGGNGNNGHGNDDDGNDDSNPGNSNDEDDDTDDDGKPGRHNDDNHHNNEYTKVWEAVEPNHSRPTRQEIMSRVRGFFNRGNR